MDYDALTNDSDEDYFKFTAWLITETAIEMKQARGNVSAIRIAIWRYLETGYGSHLTSGQLVDYFCVSTPSILDKAEYSEEETDEAVKLYDEINPEMFSRYYPMNP
jgi:hypothetical protein